MKIRNFTGDFADGLAFCAIVHHYFPDEFDFNQLNRDEKQKNFDLAFRIAEFVVSNVFIGNFEHFFLFFPEKKLKFIRFWTLMI